MNESLKNPIGILMIKMAGNFTGKQIIEIVRTCTDYDDLQNMSVIQQMDITHVKQCANKIIARAELLGVRILTYFDENYPALFAKLSSPPPILFCKGNLDKRKCIACVGTRRPTPGAENETGKVVSHLVNEGWGIVSGLAFGIDTIAHKTALSNKGYTAAVLANGLDTVYPYQNRTLAEEILNQGGALISEQMFGAKASAQNLIARNRLQSGLSNGTIVMQTGIPGGALHTARFALGQERPLAVLDLSNTLEIAGNRMLSQLTGPKVVEALKAKGAYAKLLQNSFSRIPPAKTIKSIEDVDQFLKEISG